MAIDAKALCVQIVHLANEIIDNFDEFVIE